jgi:two-component system, NarL family, nitrate/nitrite sensor histidine kinase NarX
VSVPALHVHNRDLSVSAPEVAEIVEARLAEERARWAMQIHDGLTQSVTSAVLELQAFRSRMAADADGAMEGLREVQEAIRSDLERIREVLFRLTEGSLPAEEAPEAPVVTIVREVAERWGIEARVYVEGDLGTIGHDVMDAAHGIVHEAVTNAAKHAASPVVVHIHTRFDWLQVEIEDHGRGIADVADGVPHFGMRMMRARAEDVGGAIDIGSTPGEGTRIVARLPVGGAR